MTYAKMFSAALLAGIVLFSGGCGKGKKGKAYAERDVRVRLQKLQKQTFRRVIPVQGTVEPIRCATISAKISGTLEELKVSEGDLVKEGTLLFGIDRQVLKNQVMVKDNEVSVKRSALESAKITAERSRINLRKARIDYDRSLRLWGSRATSQSDHETAEVNLRNAEADVKKAEAEIANANAQLKQAESNLIIARKNLQDSSITAPYDCTVTKTFFEEKEYVNTGSNIVRLEDLTKLQIVCYISAVYYEQITAGKTPAEIRMDGVKRGSCLVTYKAPSIDPESRTFKIKVRIPESIPLASGSLCDVDIVLQERVGMGLPSDALLLRAGNRRIAYAMDNNSRAKSYDITPGIVDGTNTEILNADQLKDVRFVISGQTFVNNGTLLREAGAKQ